MLRRMSLALIAIFLVARASAQEVPQVDPGGSVLIHGTVAVDSDGAQVTPRSGTVDYWVNLGDGLVPFSAAIENGKFEMKLPTSLESMGIGRTVLDGREAYCDFWTRESLFENKLALHALWLPEVTVRAFEAGGSRELVDLEVRQGLRSTWDGTGNWRAPDDSQLIAEHAGSPLRLVPLRYSSEFVPFSPQLRWFVRAPGYSWNFVDVDHARGGNYRVELPGAGKLTVRMNGLGSTDSAELCVARVGEEGEPKRVTVLAQAKACVEVDELAADTYVIRSTIHRDSGDAHGPCAFVEAGKTSIGNGARTRWRMAAASRTSC